MDAFIAKAKVTKADIVAGLRRLGISPGYGLMVHSSLKSFGVVEGGARTVIEALMDAVSSQGTILMPSFNHAHIFKPGSSGVFDPTQTPTFNGAIPDLFWQLPGVYRSLNPTHAFAAWGQHAGRFTESHHRTLTMGQDSPLGLLWQNGGYGLLLGVSYRVNTFHHVVETSIGAPCFGLRTEAFPIKLPLGRRVMGRSCSWRGVDCPITEGPWYPAEMERLDLQMQSTIGDCQAVLFSLQDCYKVIHGLLEHGIGGNPPCSRCPIRPRRSQYTVPSDWDAAGQSPFPDSTAWQY